MWLLSTIYPFELKLFDKPDEKKYAILSHTWGKDEITFQDIQGDVFRESICDKKGWAKVLGCCTQAREDKWDWVWIDTCCINKTDLVELSEAINSMYDWYEKASVCYVYLADIAPLSSGRDPILFFPKSRWFTRGWTLQELLAPSMVEFYDSDWNFFGSKDTLGTVISKVTSIPDRVLCGQAYNDCTIAEKLSWAAHRTTAKGEDKAYCLMGIFKINMGLQYGEGEQGAFLRLQQEILLSGEDHTLFTWQHHHELFSTYGILANSPMAFSMDPFFQPATYVCLKRTDPASNGHPDPPACTGRGLQINLEFFIPDGTPLSEHLVIEASKLFGGLNTQKMLHGSNNHASVLSSHPYHDVLAFLDVEHVPTKSRVFIVLETDPDDPRRYRRKTGQLYHAPVRFLNNIRHLIKSSRVYIRLDNLTSSASTCLIPITSQLLISTTPNCAVPARLRICHRYGPDGKKITTNAPKARRRNRKEYHQPLKAAAGYSGITHVLYFQLPQTRLGFGCFFVIVGIDKLGRPWCDLRTDLEQWQAPRCQLDIQGNDLSGPVLRNAKLHKVGMTQKSLFCGVNVSVKVRRRNHCKSDRRLEIGELLEDIQHSYTYTLQVSTSKPPGPIQRHGDSTAPTVEVPIYASEYNLIGIGAFLDDLAFDQPLPPRLSPLDLGLLSQNREKKRGMTMTELMEYASVKRQRISKSSLQKNPIKSTGPELLFPWRLYVTMEDIGVRPLSVLSTTSMAPMVSISKELESKQQLQSHPRPAKRGIDDTPTVSYKRIRKTLTHNDLLKLLRGRKASLDSIREFDLKKEEGSCCTTSKEKKSTEQMGSTLTIFSWNGSNR